MKNVNLSVIGGGYWGKNLIRVSYELGALKVICDINKDLEKTYKEKYPETTFSSDPLQIFSSNEIDGVIISSPAFLHFELAKKALLAGKDVFVEKPLALTAKEGDELVALAERQRRIIMVGHILHYHPAVIKLKELVSTGLLGKLQYIYSNRLNIGKIRNEENVLWSFAPHDISLMLSIAGQTPDSVESAGSVYLPHNVEDIALTFLRFPSGVKGHIFVSWLNPFKEQKFVVVGNKGMAVFDDTKKDEKLCVYRHKINWDAKGIPSIEKTEAERIEISEEEPLREEIKEFIRCIQTREKPLTDGKEGLRVLQVLEKAQLSLSSHSGLEKKCRCPE